MICKSRKIILPVVIHTSVTVGFCRGVFTRLLVWHLRYLHFSSSQPHTLRVDLGLGHASMSRFYLWFGGHCPTIHILLFFGGMSWWLFKLPVGISYCIFQLHAAHFLWCFCTCSFPFAILELLRFLGPWPLRQFLLYRWNILAYIMITWQHSATGRFSFISQLLPYSFF